MNTEKMRLPPEEYGDLKREPNTRKYARLCQGEFVTVAKSSPDSNNRNLVHPVETRIPCGMVQDHIDMLQQHSTIF